ncbi:hypothetical protein SAMN05443639_11048 [Stigmatella erecta]|uniref:Uncharacterized protein n=1 Tax=Stigmatella erecta TaxID=83460 RepID=A0A1I0KDQ9_9BACT|nr:hypothetical protein SAMN05443639_11048 [Stigmatella erecta]
MSAGASPSAPNWAVSFFGTSMCNGDPFGRMPPGMSAMPSGTPVSQIQRSIVRQRAGVGEFRARYAVDTQHWRILAIQR